MTALNVRHVGIVTKNLKSSIKFYKDILGFKIVKKMEETDPSLSKLMDLKKVKVTTVKCYLNKMEWSTIELEISSNKKSFM